MRRAASVLVAVLVGVGLQGCGEEEKKETCAGNPKCRDCELFVPGLCSDLLKYESDHGKNAFAESGSKNTNEMCKSDLNGLGLLCMNKCPPPDRGDADHKCLVHCIRDVNRDDNDPMKIKKLTRFDPSTCAKGLAEKHNGVQLSSDDGRPKAQALELGSSQQAALELPGDAASTGAASSEHADATADLGSGASKGTAAKTVPADKATDLASKGPSSETAGKGSDKAAVEDEQKQPSSHEGSKASVEDEQKQPSSHEGSKASVEDEQKQPSSHEGSKASVEDEQKQPSSHEGSKASVEGNKGAVEDGKAVEGNKAAAEAQSDASSAKEQTEAAKTSAGRATHMAEIRPTADVDVKPAPSHSESSVSRSSVDALGKVVNS